MLKGAEACQALRTRQPLQRDAAALAVPMELYHQLLEAAAKISPTHPATSPPTWYCMTRTCWSAPTGYYTIVVSRAADRPRNAIPQCGVAWLPMADDGDGAGDPDVTVLQLRHMLGTQGFPHSIQAIGKPGDEAKRMGEYYPQGQYVSTSAFETGLPCLIEKR